MIHCPWCQSDHVSLVKIDDDNIPDRGDVFICWKCNQLSVYSDNDVLRMPTGGEYQNAMADPEVRLAIYLVTIRSKKIST